MTSLSLSECCHLLAIDPKTLRQWLVQAQMSLHTHPTDARIKCLTSEQVHVLASLHDQVLALPVAAPDASTRPDEAKSRTPPTTLSDADLRARLMQVEAQVATLQAQLTDLALQLLKEREQRMEQRLLRLEAQLSSIREPLLPQSAHSVPLEQAMPALACHPTEKRNRLVPLIE
jgi:myosin heavy subunit